MAASPARAWADYDYLIKLLLIGDSGEPPCSLPLLRLSIRAGSGGLFVRPLISMRQLRSGALDHFLRRLLCARVKSGRAIESSLLCLLDGWCVICKRSTFSCMQIIQAMVAV